MAENNPDVPLGAVPPKPAEAAKVQPKKETVRINLPPKPSASPTIKLPTLPSGGPPRTAGVTAAPSAATATAAAPAAMAAPAARPASVAAPVGAAPTARTAVAPAAPARPVAAPAPRTAMVMGISGLDKGLIMAAAITSLIALGSVAYLIWLLPDTAK